MNGQIAKTANPSDTLRILVTALSNKELVLVLGRACSGLSSI